MIKTEDNNKLL